MISNKIRYVHTNLIAKDWKRLADFYIKTFGCEPVYPERHLHGAWVDQMTTLQNVTIDGIHLRLPGCENGPTLEIFQYQPADYHVNVEGINTQGFGHLAFHVDSVSKVLEILLRHGGTQLGDVVTTEFTGLGKLTVVYTADPEGNYIELQNWSK